MDATIESLDGTAIAGEIPALGALLHRCVHSGASVGFVLPFEMPAAAGFWRDRVAPGVRSGLATLLVARLGGELIGCVLVDRDTPPNQPHRAEIRKLLVDPAFRRRGIARSLMAAAEAAARAAGRSLLTLDTRTGDAAEPLYAGLGYRVVGTIPGYCRDPFGPMLDATTVMFKAF